MNLYENRLNTFKNWLSDFIVHPEIVAKAGFYSIDDKLTVECYSCHLKISHWNYGDNVLRRHKELSPECEFVVNSPGEDEIIIPVPIIDKNVDKSLRIEANRLATFKEWAYCDIVKPVDLARAGFFSLNRIDYCKCPFCYCEIGAWEDGDVPDKVHNLYQPECSFVCSEILPRLEQFKNINTNIVAT